MNTIKQEIWGRFATIGSLLAASYISYHVGKFDYSHKQATLEILVKDACFDCVKSPEEPYGFFSDIGNDCCCTSYHRGLDGACDGKRAK